MWTIFRQADGSDLLHLGDAQKLAGEGTSAVHLTLGHQANGHLVVTPKERQGALTEGVSPLQGLIATAKLRRLASGDPESDTVLGFGYEAWGEGRSLESFIRSYDSNPAMLRGQRYLLQSLEGEPRCHLNTLRFRPQLTGLAWLATHPHHRRLGYASLILRAVMALARMERADMKFVLFSEIDPDYYSRVGFNRLDEAAQHFAGSVAMGASSTPFTPDELAVMTHYF